MIKFWKYLLVLLGLYLTQNVLADETVTMYFTAAKGLGKEIGTINFADSKYGLVITPNLVGLTPGIHGFHIHEKPSCDKQGMAAGGHFDPKQTNKHVGPYTNHGHKGDLPVLIVDKNGKANLPLLAPKLRVADLQGHVVMIHEGGDNYSDQPSLGGGGARLACGVVK